MRVSNSLVIVEGSKLALMRRTLDGLAPSYAFPKEGQVCCGTKPANFVWVELHALAEIDVRPREVAVLLCQQYGRCEVIQKGWSHDEKYAVRAGGVKHFLRLSSLETYARKQAEYHWTNRVFALGIPMNEPLAFGRSDDKVYSLYSWLEGQEARDVLPSFSVEEQYAFGLEAGRILHTIHSLPAPSDTEEWESRFNRKIDRKIAAYQACPIKLPNGNRLIAFINRHRHLLANRPQTFQHGDYHVGNMLIAQKNLYVIDFDRFDFGDPWEEFNRISWSVEESTAFAAGMLDGYFGGKPPSEFWELLALYLFTNLLGAVPWAVPYGAEEVETMLRQALEVEAWYNQSGNWIPTWYSTFQIQKNLNQ